MAGPMVLGVIFGLVILPVALVVMWNDIFRALTAIRWGRLMGRRPETIRVPQGEPPDAWQTLSGSVSSGRSDP
ncbi:MAG: hypothetical protein J0H67_14645 [Rhodospirillales bacterium]|nr:hypothetical protein [Rhodospirillales bacterium]